MLEQVRIGDLADKRILVTGGSTGIGAAVALAFAEQGSHVAVHYNESAEAARTVQAKVPQRIVLVQGDMGETGIARTVVDQAAALLGGLDGIVNNAGGMLGRVPTTQVTPEHFDRVLDLNAKSVWEATIAAYRHLKAAGGGFVINTTSVAARNGGGGGAVIYAAAKGFVSTLTRGQAKEFVADGIRVNAVAPGLIQTPFHDRYTAPDLMATQRAAIPMGREGTPEECVGAFLFLASQSLSGYVTGQVIEVNGGQLMP
ncbi:SDR family NAD(P)-dependent oxidoreductase [Azospirillum agricola]|uniref:SDR family NAD(P)-dependent oxidoreductase n=1 Tax=Azospirillum agricola TaxID=1720247 RepID=UPI000A0EECBF|nr:SDR family oxidoreductase [Azospirillum agricola]SMH43433.1 3-oxoacyl-[acyl-carrier protein] reductase [Azospirillum lipoferum]